MEPGLVFTAASLEGLPYRAFEPTLAAGAKAPLILFLHGVGERGTDNAAQVAYAFFKAADGLFGDATRKAHPSFILAPQAPESDKWIAINRWGDPAFKAQPEPTPALAKVIRLVDTYVAAHPAVDRSRIYVTGLSMGGFGVFDLVLRRPDLFAAAATVCGRGDPTQAPKMKSVPFYIAQGAKDPLVPASYAHTMVKALETAGAKPVYHEYADLGHEVWDRAYADPELARWLYAQTK